MLKGIAAGGGEVAIADDGCTMRIHQTDSEYIKEEARQLLEAITSLQAELSDEWGEDVPFDSAKEIFFALQFDEFVVGYRHANCIAN